MVEQKYPLEVRGKEFASLPVYSSLGCFLEQNGYRCVSPNGKLIEKATEGYNLGLSLKEDQSGNYYVFTIGGGSPFWIREGMSVFDKPPKEFEAYYSRIGLPLVNIALEKRGGKFALKKHQFLVAALTGNVMVVIDANWKQPSSPRGDTPAGFPLLHILMTGKRGKVIDLHALTSEADHGISYIGFCADGISEYRPANFSVYDPSLNEWFHREYPAYIFSEVPLEYTAGQFQWSGIGLVLTYLHETGHAVTFNLERSRGATIAEWERASNLWAIKQARSWHRSHPDEHWLDPALVRKYAQIQLEAKTEWGNTTTEGPGDPLREKYSNLSRRTFRQQSLKGR